jgi:hypothetical protein
MVGPEAFLRLGAFSEVEMISADLNTPRLKLLAGSVIVDVNGIDRESTISVQAGEGELQVFKKGLYRVDLLRDRPARFQVLDGEAAVLTAGSKLALLEREQIALASGSASPAKERMTRSEGDYLEQWSKDRARDIAEVNGVLLRQQLEDESRGLPRRPRSIFDVLKDRR